jgi:pimeloyl-ACP methyl ester carboxylesterase
LDHDRNIAEVRQVASFDSNGVKIHYEDQGRGDPVILVHGFASRAEHNWGITGWYKTLAPQYRVIALDCRGHGQSDKPHDVKAYSGTAIEDDVIRLMDHLGLQRALLMGYSMGGRISMGLLVRRPERFRAVVLGGIGARLRSSASCVFQGRDRRSVRPTLAVPEDRTRFPSAAPVAEFLTVTAENISN